MRLLAFWALRGYTPAQLAALTPAEKIFLAAAREMYYNEINKAIGGEVSNHGKKRKR